MIALISRQIQDSPYRTQPINLIFWPDYISFRMHCASPNQSSSLQFFQYNSTSRQLDLNTEQVSWLIFGSLLNSSNLNYHSCQLTESASIIYRFIAKKIVKRLKYFSSPLCVHLFSQNRMIVPLSTISQIC